MCISAARDAPSEDRGRCGADHVITQNRHLVARRASTESNLPRCKQGTRAYTQVQKTRLEQNIIFWNDHLSTCKDHTHKKDFTTNSIAGHTGQAFLLLLHLLPLPIHPDSHYHTFLFSLACLGLRTWGFIHATCSAFSLFFQCWRFLNHVGG